MLLHPPSFRGASAASEPGIQSGTPGASSPGFRARRFAPSRNDAESSSCLMRPHLNFQLAELRQRLQADPVARLNRADALRRARVIKVAGIERVELRGELDQL